MPENAPRSFEETLALAASGNWPLFDVINAAQQLADTGQLDNAITLYRQWLNATSSPMAYTVYFNLGVNLVRAQRESEAEQAYRQAIRSKPDFAQGYLNLSALLGRTGRSDEAINVLYASGIQELMAEAVRRKNSPATSTSTATPTTAPTSAPAASALSPAAPVLSSKEPSPQGAGKTAETSKKQNPASKSAKSQLSGKTCPLVSILIPTHNRPHYFELALRSALAQTYPNIEIVISDNSDDDLTQAFITPFLQDKRVTYFKKQGLSAFENWTKCIEMSSGEYVNFLMDDDLFHPEKIDRMMNYFLKHPNVGIVTSFRQLIDEEGKYLPPANPTEQLFPKDTLINGQAFGEFILKNGRNVLGEPTTVVLKRKAIEAGFGFYFSEQYFVLSDVATWLSILTKEDCVYIADALSYFRIHSGQDQKNSNMKVRATIDWFRLFLASHRNGFFLTDRTTFHEMLAYKLNALTNYITANHADLRSEIYNQKEIQQLIADATQELLTA